jgi:hypothetical protein
MPGTLDGNWRNLRMGCHGNEACREQGQEGEVGAEFDHYQ